MDVAAGQYLEVGAAGSGAGSVVGPLDTIDEVVVTGVSLDSRSIQDGDVYAALPGLVTHGAAFAREAIMSGAVALLTDPDGLSRLEQDGGVSVPVIVVPDPRAVLGQVASLVYGGLRPGPAAAEPDQELPAGQEAPNDTAQTVRPVFFGVTGTNGKTTTSYLLESALTALGERTGLIGTVETRIGAQRLKSSRTTPEATDLHAILAVMREQGTTAVVMEVSSHALAQHRVDGAVFDVALFTNLSQDHLDFHPTMQDYFAAKALLFTPAHSRRGVVCVDDEWGRRLAREAQVPVVTVGSIDTTDTGTTEGAAPGSGSGVEPAETADYVVRQGHWPDLTVDGPAVSLALQCHLPGEFNVVNTAMAAVALLEAGATADEVVAAMAHEPTVPGRMELVAATHPDREHDPRCVVDFAHTPAAVDAALAALRPTTPGRLVVVLGAGGDRDHSKRPGMGAAAARWADDLVVTDDNPRTEDAAAIREAVLAGAKDALPDAPATADPDGSARRTCTTSDAGRAAHIALAVELGRVTEPGRPASDNTVVVLGKGHETGQEIAGVVHPFDDREAVRAALDGVTYRPEARGSAVHP